MVSGLLSVLLWSLGEPGWSIVLDGLSVSLLGIAMVCLAMWLRGAEEQGWNGLMLVGSLLAAFGLLSVPLVAVFAR